MTYLLVVVCCACIGYFVAKAISGWRYRRDLMATRHHFDECARLNVTPWRRSEHTSVLDIPCPMCGDRPICREGQWGWCESCRKDWVVLGTPVPPTVRNI